MPYSDSEDRRRRSRERYANDPDFKRRVNEANAKWRRGNLEAFRKYSADYRGANPGLNAEQVRKYKRTLKGKFNTLLRVAKRRNIEVGITLDQYEQLISGGICGYGCGRVLPETGGALDRKDSSIGYVWSNCIPCCEACNEIRGHDNVSYEEMFHVVKLLRTLRGETQ